MNDRHDSNHEPQMAQEKADQVVAALESESPDSPDDFRRLGDAIRQSANGNVPDACENLHDLLSATLDDRVVATAPRKREARATGHSRRWLLWGTTAAALAAVSAFIYFGPNFGFNLAESAEFLGDLDPQRESVVARKKNAESTRTRLEEAKTSASEAEKRLTNEQVVRQKSLPELSSAADQSETPKKEPELINLRYNSRFSLPDSELGRNVNQNSLGVIRDTTSGVEDHLHVDSYNLQLASESERRMRLAMRDYGLRKSSSRDGLESFNEGFGRDGYGGGGFGAPGWGENKSHNGQGGGRFGNSNEQYDPIHENPFIATQGAGALSTFSIDVDTASYANVRRLLTQGQRVPPNAVRIEELINYFDYDYPQPEGDTPFSVNMELASCPWNDKHQLLRIGLKGKEIHRDERPAANIVFLIDVSGSMNSHDKLPLLKSGFQLMVNALNENDLVSIVTYAGESKVVLEPTSGDQKRKINEAISNLKSGGSTNGSAGIDKAYELAQRNFIQEGTNKVILASDGDLNVGITSDNELVKLIKSKASEGVFLSVLGFGTGNLKDSKMEKLADNGNGDYSYIDGVREAHKVLVEGMSGSLVTIAKDVKLQLEFNPAEVKGYRLIGYENRVLATQDFDDDLKDAGEIGAGHTVTALYELIPTNAAPAATEVPKGLKYQQQPEVAPLRQSVELSDAAKSGELLTLGLRYKQPDANESELIEFTVESQSKSFSSASSEFKFAASVAAFGMLLRGSEHRGNATPQWVQQTASESLGQDASGYRAEFIDLVRRFSSAQ